VLHFKAEVKYENDENGKIVERTHFIQADSKNDAVDQLARIVHYYLNAHPKMFFKTQTLLEVEPYI
jgi:hypothetical protein